MALLSQISRLIGILSCKGLDIFKAWAIFLCPSPASKCRRSISFILRIGILLFGIFLSTKKVEKTPYVFEIFQRYLRTYSDEIFTNSNRPEKWATFVGISAHFPSEWVPTFPRNMHLIFLDRFVEDFLGNGLSINPWPSQRKIYAYLRCTSGVSGGGVAWTKWLMIDLKKVSRRLRFFSE
uniref:Uncharacterized protein n=1 Tax=Candidatus Kentrum sp. UNK TaxID=2126344 RepID=A0A451ATC7_9GAMM|nr:MAG: hypothetical protein BECKUNK1418G_GA0071005_13541 [Candidatus Kentron sp. UNK]VFK73869.1 MAG: hypothetical protein BECKUNK1418H_GA0071006_13341 [Candidatus Kentron sp. UNK]